MEASIRDANVLIVRITSQAHELATREPVLAQWVAFLLEGRLSVGRVVARLLACHLSNSHVSQRELEDILTGVLATEAHLEDYCRADLDAVLRRDPASDTEFSIVLNSKGFQALQAYRISNCLWHGGRRELARYMHGMACRTYSVDIHPASRIGPGVMLDHATGIVIGETARIEEGVSLMQGVTLGGTGKHKGDRHPKVKSGVLLGAGATVLGNVQIGENARVAAGSVVLYDVPAASTVAGIPAQIVRQHNDRVPAEEMNQLPSA
ncbi:serine O-acetyltransferase [Cupriavidus necator]|uniref:serine O-acetyltransferase n=1 Tax=Cupriavidus necator TaxID=106590 RepID=UPI0039C0685C